MTLSAAVVNWCVECRLIGLTLGSGGTYKRFINVSHSNATGTAHLSASGYNTVGINTTTTKAIGLLVQWGAADALNTVTCDALTIEVLG